MKQIWVGIADVEAMVYYLNQILEERDYILGWQYSSRLLRIRDILQKNLPFSYANK